MNDVSLETATPRTAVSVSHRLARHAVGTPYDAIPEAALDAAKRFMLDTLAVAWAGSDAPGCREAHGLLTDEGGRADANVWSYGGRLPAAAA
ncbi:MAG TPA: MmgE/PrpD family protein, partial [Burkholderiales bacterium]|nr:MmgE/PrpD family protein [Burkholderiales bacterium]